MKASRSSRVASQKQKAHSPTPIRSLRKTPARRIDTRESAKPKSPADKHPTSTSRRQQKRTSVSSSASKKRPRPSRSARVRKKSKVADKDESQSESPKVLRSSTRSRSIRLPKEQATTPSESTTARRASTKRGKKASAGNTTDEDPYDLSTDENESPTSSSGARAVSPAAPSQATEPVSKMRKFFQTRGEGLAKRTALSAFDLLRRKLCGVGGKGQVAKKRHPSSTNPTTRRPAPAHDQPMSDNERARIAATTIWLPVPPTRSLVPPQHCASTPVSCGADQRQAGGAALTARPVVLLPRLPSLESPIVVQETLGGQPLDSTAVFPEREEEEVENACTTTATAATPSTARPLSDSTNLRLSDQPMAGKPSVDVHHASFATSISPIAKRSRTSRAPSESSAHSASGRRNSRSSNSNEASTYEDWLDAFNSQLKPYEEFNLTID